MIALGFAVAFSSFAVVRAEHFSPDKKTKVSCNKSAPCFEGTNAGYGPGIQGTGGMAGVFGQSDSAAGVYGYSPNGYGVYGNSPHANAGWFTSNGAAFALVAENTSVQSSYPGLLFIAENTTDGDYFKLDGYANGLFTGEVTAYNGFQTVIRSRDGAHVGAAVTLEPSATIEDTGTARMSEGVGVVRLAADFARTLDLRSGYQVFLTPDGDTRGLYVAQKYQAGFIVRETQHGRSSLDFDYRIVAHPIGASEQRFPEMNFKAPQLRGPVTPPKPAQ